MARSNDAEDFATPLRRLLVTLLILVLGALFLFWTIDSPRAERMRSAFVDRFVPSFDWLMRPVTAAVDMAGSFQSYSRIYQQNQELRRELQQMKAWKEAAVQLEQENATLLAQNNVRLDPRLTSVSGVVLADSGSPFRQSVLINVGRHDGIVDGWAVMDGLGLVGRIAGLGESTARVLLLTDINSKLPVTIQPSGERALMTGDNSPHPPLDFLDKADNVRPGDRVVSSGDGGVFPAGIVVGQVAQGADRRLRVRLSADYERLAFLQVLRAHPAERITDSGALIAPEFQGPPLPGPGDAPSEPVPAPRPDAAAAP